MIHNIASLSSNWPQQSTPSIVSIGNFDGMHLGHQKLMNYCRKLKQQTTYSIIVITFNPSPRIFFKQQKPFEKISNNQEKWNLLTSYGCEQLFNLHFNEEFQHCTASHFIESILLNQCHCKHLVVGKNWSFGHQRQGNPDWIKKQHYPLTVHTLDLAATIQGDILSSSALRTQLQLGNLESYSRMTGRPLKQSIEINKPEPQIPLPNFPPILQGKWLAHLVNAAQGTVYEGIVQQHYPNAATLQLDQNHMPSGIYQLNVIKKI
jgi:riboflavin kinase / FMN adenylyltransferase